MSIRGSVDNISNKGASGWAYAADRPEGLIVQAVLSHEVIGDAVATDHRPDLATAGLGKGNCGYSITFYREIDPLYLPFVTIKVDGGDVELPRAGQLGFVDFFAAFYSKHPTAGRSRSVFGGLWTDRTDAAAILKGKVEIGQVDAETATVIKQLIHEGIAFIQPDEAGKPVKKDKGKLTPAELASSVTEEPRVLAALRTVFSDNPLVVSTEEVDGRDTALMQPSAENASPSPAECLDVLFPANDETITIDIIRDSHRLPEFTLSGKSRWAKGEILAALDVASNQQGLLARHEITSGTVAIIGPGTVYRLRCGESGKGLKLRCIPSRAMPVALVQDAGRPEIIRKSGVRVLS
jgi:hypothetical protein